MLVPSFCLCLAVPLCLSLGEPVCPEPTAEFGSSSITAESRVLWGNLGKARLLRTACGNSHTCGLGLGPGGGRLAAPRHPGLPVLPMVVYGEQARQPGLCLSALVPKHLQKGWKKPQRFRGKEAESPDSWGGPAVSVSPGQVATLQEPRVCQPGTSPASSNPACMAMGAGGAMVGAFPCHVLWAKPEQGDSP